MNIVDGQSSQERIPGNVDRGRAGRTGAPPTTARAPAPRTAQDAAVQAHLHPQYRRELRTVTLLLAALALIQLAAMWLPAWRGAADVAYYLPLHTLLETVSIVVSLMVFAVGWTSGGRKVSGNASLLACAFLVVGALDFSHMASYVGMPDFGTHNDAQKHVNFWLAARLVASSSLLLLVLRPVGRPSNKWSRLSLLAAALAAIALVNWVVIAHQSWLPDTFVPGVGLTPFKKAVECLVIALSLATAVALLRNMRTLRSFDPVLLLGAVCTIAMSEIYLSFYTTMAGPYNLLGHVYKVVAYVFIYRAIVAEVIDEPYQTIEKARAKFTNIFESVSEGIELISRDGVIVDLNRAAYERLHYTRQELIGKRVAELCLPEHKARLNQRRDDIAAHGSIMFESSRICREARRSRWKSAPAWSRWTTAP